MNQLGWKTCRVTNADEEPQDPAARMMGPGAAMLQAAALRASQASPLDFNEEQRQTLTEGLFEAQLATLRAIATEVARAPDADVRRNVVTYTATFAQLRGASGHFPHGPGWFAYPPFMNGPYGEEDDC
jgi:hypothetical protein